MRRIRDLVNRCLRRATRESTPEWDDNNNNLRVPETPPPANNGNIITFTTDFHAGSLQSPITGTGDGWGQAQYYIDTATIANYPFYTTVPSSVCFALGLGPNQNVKVTAINPGEIELDLNPDMWEVCKEENKIVLRKIFDEEQNAG